VGRTLVIIKPDAVERHLIGEIIKRFETAGFIVDGIKMLRLRPEDARRFYAVHEGKPFLNELCEYMSSGPIVPMIIKSDGETFARVRKFYRGHRSGQSGTRDYSSGFGHKHDQKFGTCLRFVGECRN
jgi:nucleoside diphosphate kinase